MGHSWVDTELTGVNFGDKRLIPRAKRVLSSFAKNPQASIPEQCTDRAEIAGAYRFLANNKVNPTNILKPHLNSTVNRMKDHRIVLAVQDTSTLNYNNIRKSTAGLGDVGANKNSDSKGLILHLTYAISGDGIPLGTLDAKIWDRHPSKFKSARDRHTTPIEKKESFKWIEGVQKVAEATKESESTIIHVMDREADIYSLFSETKSLNQNFIIRAKSNRKINKTSRGSANGELLFSALVSANPLGEAFLEVNSRGDVGGKRMAKVEIKAVKIKVTPPRNLSNHDHNFKHKKLEQTAIWVREILDKGSDLDDNDTIDWKLLTNVEVKTPEQALVCVEYYLKRWHIEVFFRILKTGCRAEDCFYSTAERIMAFIALMLIVTWKIQNISLFGRERPKANPDLLFTKVEQKILAKLILKTKAYKKYKAKDYVIMLARLGGFLNRKSDGMPGAEVLWRGWIRLRDFTENLSELQEIRSDHA